MDFKQEYQFQKIIFFPAQLPGVNDTARQLLQCSLVGTSRTAFCYAQLQEQRCIIGLFLFQCFYQDFCSRPIYCFLLIILYLKLSLQSIFHEPILVLILLLHSHYFIIVQPDDGEYTSNFQLLKCIFSLFVHILHVNALLYIAETDY